MANLMYVSVKRENPADALLGLRKTAWHAQVGVAIGYPWLQVHDFLP